jgi:1-acyl-sn-glycerol-3-phosphate acyltransferase
MRLSYNIIVSLIRYYIKIFYKYEVINKERLQSFDNCIIASNHISANDPPFLGAVIPKEIYYLAKSELFKVRWFGKILSHLNVIPIRRGVTDRNALVKMKEVLQNKHSILIFPEGTRSSFKPKPGIGKIAIETSTNVLPILIENSNKFKDCFWGKKRLKFYIGEIIDIKPFLEKGENKANYREFSTHVFNIISGLNNVS